MFRRCLTPFCILILLCMVSTYNSTPLGHRGALSFSNSLRLTRTIRARVQQLISQYKQQVFGGELFEYGDLKLSTLPAVTVTYQTWLHMQDTERLRLASHYLQTFWTHLERQRQQFERERDATNERREQRRDKRGRPQPTLSQSFVGLQIDLRDLMRQVNSQLRSMTQVSASTKSPLLHHLRSTSSSSPTPSMHHSRDSTKKLQTPSPTDNSRSSAHSTVQSSQTLNSADRGFISTTEKTTVGLSQPTLASTVETQTTTAAAASLWIQHLRGYVILRDLERYLSRLARDYTVLQTKY
ncbi:uncharacterized protein LOC127512865 [Ctenopharyngodon idella]|uniref:Interleukin-12 subunit alpha n=1 Tax=Ctenopharyngodon idella TaxID=7959 RepID=A0A977R5J0_CTEID|nr:uncharacterized protein LOC127512865 [Ctenopharyngodon idella]UXL82958.1 interleukin-12 subunit alpha [Ctenopharyngodon idella]